MPSALDSLLAELTTLIRRLWTRLSVLFADAPPGTLPLTGVLGLALLVGLNYARRRKPSSSSPGGLPEAGDAGGSAAARGAGASSSQPAGSAAPSTQLAGGGGRVGGGQLSWLAPQLGGARRVTLSVPGALLEEWGAEDLEDCATLQEGVGDLLQELCRCADVYVLCHVDSDIGEAVVRGALEAHPRLIGAHPGQLPPHRVLFCGTLEGKVSVVRQLEPDLHIDAHHATVEQLRRFLPRLLHIQRAGRPSAPQAPNIRAASSLLDAFGVAEMEPK